MITRRGFWGWAAGLFAAPVAAATAHAGPPQSFAELLARAGVRCEACGVPATEMCRDVREWVTGHGWVTSQAGGPIHYLCAAHHEEFRREQAARRDRLLGRSSLAAEHFPKAP
jgi:hypothetical protein